MKSSLIFALFGFCTATTFAVGAPHSWVVKSPTHEQTFSYGSERHRQWLARGEDHHLVLAIGFTNDPYVDRVEPRQYDDFTFDFPNIKLGSDGHTFYYHPPGSHPVPVASRHAGFLGIEEIDLLGSNFLVIQKTHGYLTLALVVSNRLASPSKEDSR